LESSGKLVLVGAEFFWANLEDCDGPIPLYETFGVAAGKIHVCTRSVTV
jgi:hypothetical protein